MSRPGITTGLKKIKALDKRLRIVQGGSSASKTYSILLILIDLAQRDEKPTLTSVVSETFPHLKRGSVRDFLEIMGSLNLFKPKSWNKTDYVYTFETGSKIEFFSADQPGKVRGPRRDRLFINEANNVPFETFEQLEIRTNEFVFIDYNPVTEFWVSDDIFPKRDDYDHLILTYKDNEALDENIVRSLESKKDRKNFWKVYGRGEFGELEGKIYSGWQIIDEIPHEARLVRRGLDFGYTIDPSALVDVYYLNGGYVLDEQFYQKGMSNKKIADFILDIVNHPETLVIADSAEPKSIDEIYGYGVNIRGAEKGRDSVRQGIQFLQDIPISVTKRSVNLIKEYRNYTWATDRLGKTITPNIPEDAFNHCFTGDTLINTSSGTKAIKDINPDDLVLTSSGYNSVVKRWSNGTKPVNKYRLQLDTKEIIIKCTADHKIKTIKGWKRISKLQSGDGVYLCNYSKAKNIIFIRGRDILAGVLDFFIEWFGANFVMLFLKTSMFITKMAILGIIIFKISSWLIKMLTCRFMPKKILRKKVVNGLKSFIRKELRRLKNGTVHQKVLSGIKNMEKRLGRTRSTRQGLAKFVEKNTRQDTQEYQNTVIQIARLKHCVVEGSWKEKVFDLTVDGCHEYFANGILVHNCLDASRYALSTLERRDPAKEKARLKKSIYQKKQRQKAARMEYGL